jgi:hypothetical protein
MIYFSFSSQCWGWRLPSAPPLLNIPHFRSFNTYLFVSDRILPAAIVRTIEWMGYLRSVIRPTHWVTSILNIGKKMKNLALQFENWLRDTCYENANLNRRNIRKNLSLFCLYRLLKRKPGDIYRFNALNRQFYRFDFPHSHRTYTPNKVISLSL